jgi:predicted NBD/HSP70 family sugar kinase
VALVDFDEKIRVRWMIPIDMMNDPLTIVDQVCRFALGRLQQLEIPIEKVFGVGFSLPGAISLKSGTLFDTATLPGWGGYQLESHLREVFPYALVVLERDANVMVFGELRKGLGKGHHHVLYVKIESSISTGLILDGRIYRGANGRAGSISNVQLSPADTPLERGEMVGSRLAVLVDLLDPELILLGGDTKTLGHEYLAAIRRSILSLSQSSATENLRVEIAPLGAEANMLGLIGLTAGQIFIPSS